MLGGKGVYRGSAVLVSGTAGSGKTSVAAHFADSSWRRGERCLYFAFEESAGQMFRNMRSIGLDLQPGAQKGLLQFEATTPTQRGLEMHLVRIHGLVEQFKPRLVIVDPISNLMIGDDNKAAKSMLVRLFDFLKSNGITGVFTSLTAGNHAGLLEQTEVGVSSLIDTWILLRQMEISGERHRGLYIIKSRGMAHSNQVREFVFTRHGIKLIPVYVGGGSVLTGSARLAQEARERTEVVHRQQETQRQESVGEESWKHGSPHCVPSSRLKRK
jgi:circadian clock protein KaiC